MDRKYADFAAQEAVRLLDIDSPTGYTEAAAEWVKNEFSTLGFEAHTTAKGGVLVNLGGEDETDALLLEAHTDTLGAMVAEIKGSGRLRLRTSAVCAPKTPKRRISGSAPAAARSLRAPASS